MTKARGAARSGVDEKLVKRLAEHFGAKQVDSREYTPRFQYLQSPRRFIVVAGTTDPDDIDLSLAYGLAYRSDLRLTLVLPKGTAFSVLQRSPWLTRGARPHVFTYAAGRVSKCAMPSRQESITQLSIRLKPGQSLSEELRSATAPTYLGSHSDSVVRLVDWAVAHPSLDPAHRKGMRSWQCMGQRVLSIKRSDAGIVVTAGIHYTDADKAPTPTVVSKRDVLTLSQIQKITKSVEEGIAVRLSGSFHKPDEHWLQAVIRRDPQIVGVEQPALREVPAWRPHGTSELKRRWGRGFIDLIGIDGNGDLRLVETKLAANPDHMLILQGLDYYIWAQAYIDVLRERLGAPKKSQVIVHYVIGATPEGKIQLSKHAQAQSDSIAVPHRFQSLKGWFKSPGDPAAPPSATLHPEGERLSSWST